MLLQIVNDTELQSGEGNALAVQDEFPGIDIQNASLLHPQLGGD